MTLSEKLELIKEVRLLEFGVHFLHSRAEDFSPEKKILDTMFERLHALHELGDEEGKWTSDSD